MYKSENGITFMILVITVLILVLIGSAAVGAILSTYKDSKVKVYIEEMDTIKEKLALYEEKAKLNSDLTPLVSIGKPASEDSVAVEVLQKLENASGAKMLTSINNVDGEDKYKNYRLLSSADVQAVLGVENMNKEVLFDVLTKEVYSLSPIEYEGEMYYSADDIRGEK